MAGFWVTLLAETDPGYLREHLIRAPEENKPQNRLNAELESPVLDPSIVQIKCNCTTKEADVF